MTFSMWEYATEEVGSCKSGREVLRHIDSFTNDVGARSFQWGFCRTSLGFWAWLNNLYYCPLIFSFEYL